ncbi:glutaredoxin family protein [Xylophilus sp. ASV27]|uniref:glutaredoxin family protein n=1 Tax=Xylophilus sp. ASV27 TaxID=2795129 RepID=UPI0018EDE01D|nr:glutaredoxin family protein [Xylophilus sp. ASV27]
MPTRTPHIAVLLLCALGAGAQAQQVFRIVGPDGRVTFSDRPDAPAQARVAPLSPRAGAPATAHLPYELKQVADRYPVTLYSTSDCEPCASARALLNARGVPFAEKTVTTPEDSAALKRISGDTSLPFATLGAQQLKGFSSAEWNQYLDAAGYPKQSQLPANYQASAPTPLVARRSAPAPAPAQRTEAPAAPAPVPAPANPAGIRF